jgi:methylmalonyl-CoA/ethylmalonyl-CoA epimerase
MQDGDIIQLAHVVLDVDAAMKHYRETFGYGPWDVYEFRAPLLRESMYRGKSSGHEYIVAVTWVNGVQLELMQPVSGYSIYNEYLEQNKGGFHHAKIYFKDCLKAVADLKRKGYEVIQSGKIGEDEFYYLDTEKDFGVVWELGNVGTMPPRPARVYPG